MTARAIERRLCALEQALKPVRRKFAFIEAQSDAEVEREIERLEAECPEGMPETLFIMVGPEPERAGDGG